MALPNDSYANSHTNIACLSLNLLLHIAIRICESKSKAIAVTDCGGL
jgi:hypothetical protein